MDINASIVDQRLNGIVDDHPDFFPKGLDSQRKKSYAFVLYCVKTALGLGLSEAADLMTEGTKDTGVDAIHIGDVDDGEFEVTLFQGKYKHKDLTGTANFPEGGVKAAISTVITLFDPSKQISMNERLKPKVEEARSLIRDGYIPVVKMVLCNNGARWTTSAEDLIKNSGFSSEQVSWIHLNHEEIVRVLKSSKSVDDTIKLHGAAIIEDFNFRRVLVGKVSIKEVAELFNRNGEQLLERNIRRYLGVNRNRVNAAIHSTLLDEEKRKNFYFFNNGITMICNKFRHNALQGKDYQLNLNGIQIINGGQSCKTIQETFNAPDSLSDFSDTYILLRLYELAEDDQDFVQDITYATNSQNPVDLRDLRSNDDVQMQLEIGMRDLGFEYRRKRDETAVKNDQLSSSVVGESVLAVWRKKPHQAKFRRKDIFGKLYNEIFDGLNSAQAIIAAIIFRLVENERKRPVQKNPPLFLPYASHYKAMLVGDVLIKDLGVTFPEVDHKVCEKALVHLDEKFSEYQVEVQNKIQKALGKLYGGRDVSLQQLSATFRRGDLLYYLDDYL
ncbi:AIPR family protein [Marinagarivorans cellulosilyticus]|uniref:Abortive phage infection protein C-terminal domain-containing protein n=1 Tax=Marinagarivorans cellulosilyticus TaxID=2721545 RepID=A0AAN1WGC9_9GAMM|nr:AIPR family protein [Marinagarivorans cellulosilyticus]BCD97103.1 hypothetical protein MARGE09_P1303 [Marinagarivorans cellulosilyticus]